MQAAATDLNQIRNLPANLSEYLDQYIIKYQGVPEEDKHITFTTDLVKSWLPKCRNDPANCLSETNKKDTVEGIIKALNQAYNPQNSPSTSATPSPASSPTPTSTTSSSPEETPPSGENSRQRSISPFLGLIGRLILLLGSVSLGFWVLSKNNRVRKLLGQDISEHQSPAGDEGKETARANNLTHDQTIPTDLQQLQADLQELSTVLQSPKEQIRPQQSRTDSLAQSKQSDFSKLDEKLNLIAQRFEEKFSQLEAKIQILEETGYKPQSPSPIILSEHNPAMVEILNRYRKNGKDFFESGEYVTIANPVNFPKVLTLSPKSKTNFALIRTENQGYIVPKPDYSAYSKLQSCFELVGSQEYGDTCLEEPARVIPVGSDWHIVQKGKVSFKGIPED